MQAGAFFAGCVAAGALAGCALDPVPDSDLVSTRDLSIQLTAADDGGGAGVRIRLTGPLGAVRLAGGDALRLTAAGAVWPLVEMEASDGTAYVAELGAFSGDLVLDLERPNDRSALGLTAAMPPPFTLAAQGVSAAQPLVLTWEPGAGDYNVRLSIAGDCIRPLARDLAADTGSYTVQAAELVVPGPNAPATCPLVVSLSRVFTTREPLVPSLEGGSFDATATQARSIEVSWQP
jgi:hypothetical protein